MFRTPSVALLILFGLIGIGILTFFYSTIDHSKWPNDYAIVFDAGSSGTRMYVYQWKANFSAARGDPIIVTEKISCRTDDKGIDKIKSQQEIESSFSKCMKKAEESIPDERKSRAYIFLAATAGMRLLEAQNKTASNQVFEYIRNYFKQKNFLFANSSQVRIISGQEEGTNAWISANYFEGNFKVKNHASDEKPKTKGILDLGGASTQIVYVPNEQDPKYPDFHSKIRIYGIDYKPYSHSFLCYGVNEFSNLYMAYVLKNNDYNNSPVAACYPTNSEINLNINEIFNSPCANGLLFKEKFPFNVDLNKIDRGLKYTFQGKSDPNLCVEEVKSLLPNKACKFEKCSFHGIYQPSLDEAKSMGFSGFFYALSNTGKLFKKKFDTDLDEFKAQTKFVCSKTVDELKQINNTNKAGISEKHLIQMCFFNNYVIELLTSYGYTNFENLKITDKVNGYNLNWALGYLINELNRDDFLPYEEPPRKLQFLIFLPLTILFGVIIVLLVGFVLYYRLVVKRRNQTPKLNPLLERSSS